MSTALPLRVADHGKRNLRISRLAPGFSKTMADVYHVEVRLETHGHLSAGIDNFGIKAAAPNAAAIQDIATVANWIGSLQYTDDSLPSYGAVKVHHNPGFHGSDGHSYFRVVPYHSSLGVYGLLRAPVEGRLEVAERWMIWYLAHLNQDGTVYDHWYRQDGSGETTCPPGIGPALCNVYDASRMSPGQARPI